MITKNLAVKRRRNPNQLWWVLSTQDKQNMIQCIAVTNGLVIGGINF